MDKREPVVAFPRTPGIIGIDSYKKFAVLMPVISSENGLAVVFEVRAAKLKSQPGEVCFPGGSLEPGESEAGGGALPGVSLPTALVTLAPAALTPEKLEAALRAARLRRPFITMEDLQESVIKVLAGPEKKSRVVIQRERKLTAYHEAGHALVIHALDSQDPVHQITIVPRGMAGGMTIHLPKEDKSFQSKKELTDRIAVCLGGRCAEQLVLGDVSTGAGSDLQQASSIARNMVMRYGMSDRLGNVVFDSGHDEVFIGRSMAQAKSYSEEVAAQIDSEVKAIIDKAYHRCQEVLEAHREQLIRVAEYLLEYETMSAEDFTRVMGEPKAVLKQN